MLDDYINRYSVAYDILKHQLNNNSLIHAYLIYSGESDVASNFAFSFAKTLICPSQNTNSTNCCDCKICHRIDNNNFSELKIIEPDGLWIKKDQLIELQEKMKTKSLEGTKRVYIINYVEKLNTQAANSILKFLEEPEENIIAILTTNDLQSVLPTIVSRCQIVNLKTNKKQMASVSMKDNIKNETMLAIGSNYYSTDDAIISFASDEHNMLKTEAVVNFIKQYEINKMDVLLDTKKLWHNFFVTKEDNIFAFEIMELFYQDVLNCKFNRNLEFFNNYSDTIDFVTNCNNQNEIIKKIKKIVFLKEKIKYNINLNLLVDKLVFDMESGDFI